MKHNIVKACLFSMLVLLSMNVAQANVVFGVGSQFGSDVQYVPGHWEGGYWIPGQYVEYTQPASGFYMNNGYGDNDHWRRGYNDHNGYRGHNHNGR